MTLFVAPIVEGQTEQKCVERLLQRVWRELLCRSDMLRVLDPFRGPRDSLVHSNGLTLINTAEKAALKLAAESRREANSRSLLLILLDAEGECPKALAPRLLTTAQQAVPPATPIACVLAKRMIENWIAAGCSTLGGISGLPNPVQPPPNAEECSGTKWLDGEFRKVAKARKYSKTTDGPALVSKMNLIDCHTNARSFRKLCKELASCLPPPPPPDPPAE